LYDTREVSEYDTGDGYEGRYGNYNKADWEEGDSSTTIKELRDAEGEYIDCDRFFPEDKDFLDEDWTAALGEPASEEYEGNLGNESATRETTYHTSVLVFWPSKMHAGTMTSLGCEEYSLETLMDVLDELEEEERSITPDDLPFGVGSAREWLNSAIRQECTASGPRLARSMYAPGTDKRLLAMQGMAKLGSSDDVIKLLKTFTPLLTASPELIKVR
jgi:hypothetical protein